MEIVLKRINTVYVSFSVASHRGSYFVLLISLNNFNDQLFISLDHVGCFNSFRTAVSFCFFFLDRDEVSHEFA